MGGARAAPARARSCAEAPVELCSDTLRRAVSAWCEANARRRAHRNGRARGSESGNDPGRRVRGDAPCPGPSPRRPSPGLFAMTESATHAFLAEVRERLAAHRPGVARQALRCRDRSPELGWALSARALTAHLDHPPPHELQRDP